MLKESSLREVDILLERYPMLVTLRQRVIATVELLADSYRKGGKILICGNGGSAADSLHIVGELMKRFVRKRTIHPGLQKELKAQWGETADYYIENLEETIPAISLVNESSLLTAYSNDKTADLVFAQQVLGYGKAGDVLICISTSGSSANVLHAAKVASTLGMHVISMTGERGGKLKEVSEILLNVPSAVTYQIQEFHLPIYHTICLMLEAELFT